MGHKITIIVPVYNVKDYLPRCVNSLLAQTIYDIEIILVDDGSIDGSDIICDEYAKNDDRIKVIHKKNSGVSAARNDAINISTGEFIGFVDADDIVAKEMFEVLYESAKRNKCDVAICDFEFIDRNMEKYIANESGKVKNEIISSNDAISLVTDFNKNVQVTVWNKLFKKEIINGIYFDINKKIAEDLEFLIKVIIRSNRIVYIPTALYGYYKQREGAATYHKNLNLQSYFERSEIIGNIMEYVIEKKPELKNNAKAYKSVNGDLAIANAMVRMNNFNKSDMKRLHKELKNNLWSSLKSNLHLIKKMQILIFIISPKLYRILLKNRSLN